MGFILSSRGIEANPNKCQAILDMSSPKGLKEIQQLTGRLAALSRFLSRAAEKSLPFFKVLKKANEFEWTEECHETFLKLKEYLSSPPVLTRPSPSEVIIVYLAISDYAVGSVLVCEREREQHPVYFVSKALQGAELRYPRLTSCYQQGKC